MINQDINDDLQELLQALADLEANNGSVTYAYKGISASGSAVIGTRNYHTRRDEIPTVKDREMLSVLYRLTFRNGLEHSAEPSTLAIIPFSDLAKTLEVRLTIEMCHEIRERLERCNARIDVVEIQTIDQDSFKVTSMGSKVFGGVRSEVETDGDVVSGHLLVTWVPGLRPLTGMQIGTYAELGLTAKQIEILENPNGVFTGTRRGKK